MVPQTACVRWIFQTSIRQCWKPLHKSTWTMAMLNIKLPQDLIILSYYDCYIIEHMVYWAIVTCAAAYATNAGTVYSGNIKAQERCHQPCLCKFLHIDCKDKQTMVSVLTQANIPSTLSQRNWHCPCWTPNQILFRTGEITRWTGEKIQRYSKPPGRNATSPATPGTSGPWFIKVEENLEGDSKLNSMFSVVHSL